MKACRWTCRLDRFTPATSYILTGENYASKPFVVLVFSGGHCGYLKLRRNYSYKTKISIARKQWHHRTNAFVLNSFTTSLQMAGLCHGIYQAQQFWANCWLVARLDRLSSNMLPYGNSGVIWRMTSRLTNMQVQSPDMADRQKGGSATTKLRKV